MRRLAALLLGFGALVLSSMAGVSPAVAGGCLIGQGECSVSEGAVVCTSYSGLRASDRNMNDAQLKSIGCVRAGHTLKAGAVTESGNYDSAQMVKVVLPDRVMTVWVKDYDTY